MQVPLHAPPSTWPSPARARGGGRGRGRGRRGRGGAGGGGEGEPAAEGEGEPAAEPEPKKKPPEYQKNEEGADEWKKMRAAPTNTAELIVLEWANCVSRLADVGTVGSNMPPWRPLLDFEKSCADGTQLTRILYYVLHAHDEKYLNANKIEPPGAELVPPELRVPHLWTRPLKDPQIDAFKADVFSNKDHANDLRDVLEDFAKRTLGLPAPLLKASDIQKQDAHWNFTVLSYLMLTSPGVRTNTHAGVFEVVMALEEFGRRGARSRTR